MSKEKQDKIDKLDSIFSQYIRLRDSDEYGMIICISCGKRVRWKESDAGHFISRGNMSLRFNKYNVNAQCKQCNQYECGNIEKYTVEIKRKYGTAILQGLIDMKKNEKHWINEELDFLIRFYEKQVKVLFKNKSL